jgi:hypothetical protein
MIVEINGVKLEVDERSAKTVESYKVGDTVRVLVKKYGDWYDSYPGAIIGFDAFQNLPSIRVAYLEHGYPTADIKFVVINANTKDVEIAPALANEIPLEKGNIEAILNGAVLQKQEELRMAQNKLEYFRAHFAAYFKTTMETKQENQ